MKKLPIGISTLEEILNNNYVYIDKTKDAFELISNHKYAFLSRPRRFGKSLFLDTLKEIFEGNKELFKGLYIYNKYEFESYPVIHISFSGNMRSPERLEEVIDEVLQYNQRKLGIECSVKQSYDNCFKTLIQKSHEKYQKKVVILIDEYDKAILDNLDQMEMAKEAREIIKSLYGVMKDNDKYIHFVFLTGVSKFSKASIFSGLNNIEDITLNPRFGTICGYRQEDIETTFLPYLEGVDLSKLQKWYNGYNFLSDKVYNPFDILLFISNNHKFNNYWFNTGTPSFLIKLFAKGEYNLAEFENLLVEDDLLNSFDIENLSFETVMFQSGYLTIKEVEVLGNDTFYHLTFPNIEVKKSFNDYVLSYYFVNRSKKAKVQMSMYKLMAKANLDELKTTLDSLLASIAYNNFTKNEIANYEGFYASIIYAYFAGAGFERIVAEDVTVAGRIDFTVMLGEKLFIFEFKVASKGALQQIKEKAYHKKYESSFSDIYLIGVEFDSESRSIVGYEWESVG